MPLSARYLLAAACFRAGRSETAKALLGRELPSPSEARDTGGVLLSPARETAILLSCLLEVDPESPFIEPLLERLRQYKIDGRWGTTQENAFALLALGKYAKSLGATSSGFTAEVKIGDAAPVTIRVEEGEPSHWKFEGDSVPGAVRVAISGQGVLFYSWTEEGIPFEVPQGAVDNGLRVRRRYLDASGSPLNLSEVKAGETVVVEIALSSERFLDNVAVVDLLPGGLEVENPSLEGKSEWVARLLGEAARQASAKSQVVLASPTFTSHRDDRVISFVDVRAGTCTMFYHVLRAVTRGEFQVPPVRAEALYDPRISSISGAARMSIR